MSLRTCCRNFSLICVLLVLAILATPAFAQTCVTEEFGKKVQCTANDVRIAAVTNTRNLDGTPITTCNIGDRISFVATYQVVTSSTSSRSNIGLYFATDNQASAVSGSCFDNIIPPVRTSMNAFCTGPGAPYAFCTGNGQGTSTATLGSSNYTELDPQSPSADNCGDGNASSAQFVDVQVQNVLCEPTSITDAHLRLPNCTTWQVPGQTIACSSPAPTYPWVPAAIPGTGSKCNCGVLSVPIIVQHAAIGVTKTASPTTLTGSDGGAVGYTVVVTNNSNLGGVTINQLCDDKYGNIATATTTPAQNPCAAGTLGAATNIVCPLPAALAAPGNTVTCTFTGTVPENATTVDTVTANGVDQNNPPNAVSGTAFASVTAGDAPSSAQTTKTLVGAQAACYTVRYGAKVHNSSSGDETLTLSGLSDNMFQPITSLHGDAHTNNGVVGTTCGVADGLGTLQGSGNGAGAFNQTLGADYSCQFDGVICGTAGSVTKPDGSQCIGIQHSNTVTPTLTGDEGETVSNTGGTLTVTECLSEFHQ